MHPGFAARRRGAEGIWIGRPPNPGCCPHSRIGSIALPPVACAPSPPGLGTSHTRFNRVLKTYETGRVFDTGGPYLQSQSPIRLDFQPYAFFESSSDLFLAFFQEQMLRLMWWG